MTGERRGGPPLASFTIEVPQGKPAWSAVPVVNGHEVMTATAIDIHISPEEIPQVTLKLIAADLLRAELGDACVGVSDETREALVAMGWTPPPGQAPEASSDAEGAP